MHLPAFRQPIQFPPGRIIPDVFANAHRFGIIANDVFPVIPLPQFSRKRPPPKLSNPTDIFVGGHGFEPLHHRSNGVRPYDIHTIDPQIDHNKIGRGRAYTRRRRRPRRGTWIRGRRTIVRSFALRHLDAMRRLPPVGTGITDAGCTR